jgi:ubiquinone/menaquinone biosynthesis C-methylase UbiE
MSTVPAMSRFAKVYARISLRMEEAGVGEHRRVTLAGLRGRVIELGCGNGLNFRHYPPEVTQVVAVEPDAFLREIAVRNAAKAPVSVEVVDGVAEHLPGDDASFDAGVATLVLCTVPDVDAALAELRRVVRPGGELRFFEHVLAPTPGMQRVQRFLDGTFWPKIAGGCHTARDTRAAIERAGFELDHIDAVRFPDGRVPVPTASHILGSAVRR